MVKKLDKELKNMNFENKKLDSELKTIRERRKDL